MYCQGCKHKLIVEGDRTCPECGRNFDPQDRRTWDRVPGATRYGLKFSVRAAIGLIVGIALYLVTWPLYFEFDNLGHLVYPLVGIPMAVYRRRWIVLLAFVGLGISVGGLVIAYNADGWPISILVLMLGGVPIAFTVAMWLLHDHQVWRIGLCGMAALAVLLFVPRGMLLGVRWIAIEREITAITAYADERMRKDGAYPLDLTGYMWIDPELEGRRVSFKSDGTAWWITWALDGFGVHHGIDHVGSRYFHDD